MTGLHLTLRVELATESTLTDFIFENAQSITHFVLLSERTWVHLHPGLLL